MERRQQNELQLRVRQSETGEGHNDLRRNGNAGRLNGHEAENDEVPRANAQAEKKRKKF